MPIEIKMPALSPTMEDGTLATWLVKEGDTVKSGDILAEIETDKATMEFETIDEGTVAKLVVPAGTGGVKVGATILLLETEGGEAAAPAKAEPAGTAEAPAEAPPPAPAKEEPAKEAPAKEAPAKEAAAKEAPAKEAPKPAGSTAGAPPPAPARPEPQQAGDHAPQGDRMKASPLARRIAAEQNVDLAKVSGSGPGGRVVKADVAQAPAAAETRPAEAKPAEAKPAAPAAAADGAKPAAAAPARPAPAKPAAPVVPETAAPGVPAEAVKLSSMRKVIARRLTESKQQVPHIYLTVDCRLDALLKLRTDLNKTLDARGIKLSVNDLLIKAQALALLEVPSCNVMFAGDVLVTYRRADISVAVSIPGGLITPIVADAGSKSVAAIATEMKDLSARAREGKLKPEEFMGGTASISNMGMFGIKHFDAVINPPQAMILAVGAGEKRPWADGDQLTVATVMTVTGSFDHRAIDGADGAQFMAAFKRLVEAPLALLA